MAKRLGSHKSSGSGINTVYTVPTGKTAEVSISVVNNGASPARIYLYVAPSGTPANDYMIQNDLLNVSLGYERTGLVLKAGEYLIYKTDQADTVVTVYGIESDSANSDKTTNLITTNTDTTIYANGSGKNATLDVSVVVGEGTVNDTCVVELYVTTTDVASGYLLQKETITQGGTTGFSREGLAISTTDKLIMRTTGIVGQVATRTSGFVI